MMRKLVLSVFSLFSVTVSFAQLPEADFSLPEDVCLKEPFILQNSSTNAESYQWDFCEGDLQGLPSLTLFTEDGFNLPIGASLIQVEDKWYGFVTNVNNSSVFRISFGDSLHDTQPDIVNLGNIGGLIRNPQDIKAIKSNGKYYLFVNNRSNNKLIRVNLGADIEAISATSTIIAKGNGYINGGVDIAFDGINWVAFLTNKTSLTRILIGSDIENTPSLSDVLDLPIIPEVDEIRDVKLVEESEKWYGFIAGFRSKTLHRLTFGNDLLQVPSSIRLNVNLGIQSPFGVTAEKDNNQWLLFSTTREGDFLRFDVGTNIANNAPSWEKIGQVGNAIKVDMAKSRSHWVGLTTSWSSKNYVLISFPQPNCSFNQVYSTNVDTVNLAASESGTFSISLRAKGANGLTSFTTENITITEDQAPTIDFQLSSQCIGSTSTVSASADQTLSSTDWIINSEALMGEIVTYDFPTPGTYEVTLEVESANGCGNRLTREITIYEPPDPEFMLPAGIICTNGAIALNNLTDAKGADDLITYQWLVDGELVSEEANPSIVFEEGGNKTLSLAASVPGCTETFETAIDVIQGPTVDFTLPVQLCAGEVITLENQTSGDGITDYEWSFGDGGSLSTLSAEAVEYTFAEAGTYNIALTANTSSGCANVANRTVTVFEQPTVGFTSDVACAGVVTLFTDTTTAGSNANIIGWNWDFGDGSGTSEVRNPSYTFPSAGTYTVSLTTQSSGGCAATSTQTVTVESPVSPAFVANRVCPTETDPFLYQFEDNSTVVEGETIVQRLWTVNGENFTDEEITYPFTEAGTYEVSLTTFASSGCNARVSQLVEVRALPQVQFAAATGCVGEPITLENQSGLNGWEVAQYTWDIASVGAVFEESPTVVFSEAGEFPVTLTLETETGCTFSWNSTVVIQPAPSASFEVSQLTGGAPFMVSPSNLSTDYSEVQWRINGELVSEEVLPSFTLETLGTYELALVALNDIGCTDTARQVIEVVNPTLDIAVGELLRLDSDGSSPQLVLSIENQGTLAVSDLTVLVQLGDVVALTEQVDETLLPGQRLNYPLQTTLTDIRNQRTPVEYICAEVNVGNEADENLRVISESDTTNNRACLALAARLLVETPFPNPAGDEVVVSVLLEEAEAVQLRLISSMGELILAKQLLDAQSGLNTVVLDVSQTPAGIYTLEVTAAGQTISRRVIVRP
ncbi:MAG: PKD domain-containing protein [Bacteroidota bacterium]